MDGIACYGCDVVEGGGVVWRVVDWQCCVCVCVCVAGVCVW